MSKRSEYILDQIYKHEQKIKKLKEEYIKISKRNDNVCKEFRMDTNPLGWD